MNILMMTNTYFPHVGGVARSVQSFTSEYRRLGHRVVVVAPEFEGTPEKEKDVVRLPAIQHFNGSDFSVQVPIPGILTAALAGFQPDVIHSHHPFLLGDTAVRVAHVHRKPLVFTHHTMYEQYTHYMPGDSSALKTFAAKLSSGYANLADHVFAPSESVARCLKQRGVRTPIEVVPTGVEIEWLSRGVGDELRSRLGIPRTAFVIGHLGRLAPEKNLGFLARAVATAMQRLPRSRFLVIGKGPFQERMKTYFSRKGLEKRLHFAGVLEGKRLAQAYHAMDVFAFSSKSETQGLVLVEAMSAGIPVVAVDSPGVREVVRDGVNGKLLSTEDMRRFARALEWTAGLASDRRAAMKKAARNTAEHYSLERCARRALRIYESLLKARPHSRPRRDNLFGQPTRWIKAEWDLMSNLADATSAAWDSRAVSPLR